MEENNLQQKVLELKQEKGYMVREILSELNITEKEYNKINKELIENGLIDEEKIKKAKRNRKARERRNNPKVNLSDIESDFRKKCIDLLARKYLDYDKTHKLNPILITKIQNLHSINSYETIYLTILDQQSSLDYANKKSFSSEVAKISYLIKIIQNNTSKIYDKQKQKEKELEGNKKMYSEDLVGQLNREIKQFNSNKIDMTAFLDD